MKGLRKVILMHKVVVSFHYGLQNKKGAVELIKGCACTKNILSEA